MSDISNLGNKKILASNLKHYLNEQNKTASDVCKDLKLTPSTFSDWLNAKKYPRIDKLEMLANYFDIPKSYLIEDKNDQSIDETDILYNKYKDFIPEKDKNIIRAIIEETKKEIDKEQGED